VDERFDPAKALAATGRYLNRRRTGRARGSGGRLVPHGIGNLDSVLAATATTMRATRSSTSTPRPDAHARAYRLLYRLGDDSKTYLLGGCSLSARSCASTATTAPSSTSWRTCRRRASSRELVLHPDGAADEHGGGTLRPEASALLAYIRHGRGTGERRARPLRVARRHGCPSTSGGDYASDAQAQAFQYMLDRSRRST
jgi:hypothetical protein